ncbi:unnamed protein product [Medioppia subpectinata]|uniref:Beta-lactamase-related domain-containing protein n=1 Tax=Medioppia subpectinata TaxID=1979941 RepID=A0A7R9KFC3_9ACAR|nr:unnamed protein product [Medioppia subpectinata]CAG2102335.1 unnamed protein product [Medioppia subpectinata]
MPTLSVYMPYTSVNSTQSSLSSGQVLIRKFNSIEDVIKDGRNQMKTIMKENSIPGTVIGFSINGTNVWTEGFGYTDVENDVITHKDSIWRLASISKPLTSALIGRLMDKKLIDLNHDIHTYLSPDFYPYKTFNGSAVNITVREVMSHMAGLHFSNFPEDFVHVFRAVNVSQTIAQFKDEKLLSKPNTKWSYSNYGYQMVGAIIEAVLNSTYDKEIEKMFRQLNMNSTFVEKREAIYKHRPQYYTNTTKLEKSDIVDELVTYEGNWPAGGIIATASDLLRFGNAMISANNGKQKDFLSKETVKELWTPETIGKIKPIELGKDDYAKGWFVTNIPESDPYPYKTIILHSGGLSGTSTWLILFPKQNIVGVAFANRGVTYDGRNQMKEMMEKQSIPGTVIGFSINGTNVWTEGFGYTDVENDVTTHKDSVWRLCSISKSLTSALIGRLMDKKLIDLNHDIHTYLSPDFYPYKTFNGSAVNITVREVMAHLAGLGDVKFLSEKTVKELWTPETIGKIKPKDWIQHLGPFEYAKAWFIKTIAESDPYPYKTIMWHGGNLDGVTTMLLLFPKQNIVGVVFTNKELREDCVEFTLVYGIYTLSVGIVYGPQDWAVVMQPL